MPPIPVKDVRANDSSMNKNEVATHRLTVPRRRTHSKLADFALLNVLDTSVAKVVKMWQKKKSDT